MFLCQHFYNSPFLLTQNNDFQFCFQVAVEEKEDQCKTFRELLLEKENEIEELSQRVVGEDAGDQMVAVKQRLTSVLTSRGEILAGDESCDDLITRISELTLTNGHTDSSAGDGGEVGEKEKLLSVTKKLKDECVVLRGKLAEMEAGLQDREREEEDRQLKQSLEEVTRDKRDIENRARELEEENKRLMASQEDLESEKADCFKRLQELQAQVHSQGEELTLLKQTSTAAQSDQSESETKLQEVLNENVKLEQKLQELETTKSNYIQEIEKLQNDAVSLQNSLADDAVKSENVVKELNAIIEKNEGEVLKLQALSSALQSEVDNCKAEVSKLQSENEDYVAEKQKSITELSKSSSEIENLNTELAKVHLQLEESNLSLERKQGEVETLHEEIQAQNEQIRHFKLDTEHLQQANDFESSNLSKEKEELTENFMKLKTEISIISAEKERLETDLKKQENQIEQSSALIASLKLELNQSNALNEQLGSELSENLSQEANNQTLQILLQSIEQECQEYKLKIETTESENREVNEKNEKLTIDLKITKDELNRVNEQLQNSQNSSSQDENLEEKLSAALKASSDLRIELQEVSQKYGAEISEMQIKLNSSSTQLELFTELEEKYQECESRNMFLSEEIQSLRDSSQQLHSDYNASLQENEDLNVRISHLSSENETMSNAKVDNESNLMSLNLKLDESGVEIEGLKKSLDASQDNIKSLELQISNLKSSFDESSNRVKEMTEKENNYIEALDSLKSINEMITKTARDNETSRLELEKKCSLLQAECEGLINCNKEVAVKNVELASQVDLLMSRKVEMETEIIQYSKKIQVLEDDLKNVTSSKENTVTEEKDVDESEQQMYDNNMVHVLNEKIREITQLKSENRNLFQTIASEKEAKDKLQAEIEESKETLSSMNAEALKKLSMLIRDKDLEIESLSERNKSLLEVLENEKGVENDSCDREKALLDEIQKLKEENSKNKDSVDHSNELKYLKSRIEELEIKLNSVDKQNTTSSISSSVQEPPGSVSPPVLDTDASDRSLVLRLETKSVQLESSEKEAASLSQEITELKSLFSAKEEELTRATEEAAGYRQKAGELEQEVERVRRSLLSVQSLLDEKTSNTASHQEQSLRYIAEAERLAQELAQATQEKEASLAQARARTQETQDLRREVAAVIEKKRRVEGEVERLRGHLVQVEEGYTLELVEGEDREKELRRRVAQLEDQLRVATHTSTEVTQSASQASSQLTAALEAAAGQRDQLSDELASCQATLRTRNMELRNLQLALEGFQKQKENELGMVERTAEERVAREARAAADTEEKLRNTRQQLERAHQGLEAAARLSEQLDKKSSVISNLKQEVSVREEMVKSLQARMLDIANGQVGKVDRDLVKNLVIGFATADGGKKPEILKIIATVLDFNGEERARTGLDSGGGGWLGGLLGAGGRSRHPSGQPPVDQNIARAFVRFLEEESSPRAPVTLPVLEMARSKAEQLAQAGAGRGTKPPSPLLSSPSPALALPSLATAAASPSILKSVLDEEENGNHE